MSVVSDFFKDVFNFLKSGSVLGVDIGTVAIKIVEFSQKRGSFKFDNYGILETKNYLEHSNQAIQTSSLRILEKEAVALLKILLKELKPKTKTAVAAIPAFASFATTLDMPVLSRSETARAVMFQAPQYIPLPMSAVSIEWFKIEEFVDERGVKNQRLFLVGIPHDILRRYKNIFSQAGLRLVFMEIEGLALVRALAGLSGNAVTLVADIGAESTNIVVAQNGILKHVVQSDYGGGYLTQALARGLGLSNSRAEELKRRKGLLASGAEFELSTLITPFLDVIIQETRHAQDVFERRYNKKIEKIILVGGGAKLLGIDKYVSAQVNLPVSLGTIFQGTQYPLDIEPAIKGLNSDLTVAVGLAKKYFL